MKSLAAGLLENVVSSYDQTKTTISGRVTQKTISGNSVLGPPLNLYVDVFNDSGGLTTPITSWMSPNGRIYSIGAEATGLSYLTCHEYDFNTGLKTYVGNIRINIPDVAATTTTFRSIRAVDTGTTGWKIFITTIGSVAINGGTFLINNIDRADFLSVGATVIPFATGNSQKAVYFIQDPSNIGVGQLQISSAGSILDSTNNRLYVHNGTAAVNQFYVYDTSISPTYSTNSVTGLAATDVITDTGHTFVNNTPVTFTSLTGGAGLLATTTYFVVGAVAGVSYQLSATSGGAAINFTTDITSATIGRAFGTTGSNFIHKTGNLPALSGTLLLLDCEDYAEPQHTANAGFPCVFLSTTTTMYLGRISELTSGATTWPSLVSSNLLGTANQIVAPTAAITTWSNVLDKAVILTNANIFIMKQMVNNVIDLIFGGNNNIYRAGFISDVVPLQSLTYTSLDIENGVMCALGGTAGQQGNYICDLRSHELFDYSHIITKVLDTPSAVYKFLTTVDELYDYTGSLKIQYRLSGFGSISGGWTDIDFAQDITAFATGAEVQFKILFDTLGLDTSIHAQLREFYLGYETLSEISEHWEFSDEWSDNNTPSRVAFRLKKAYATSIPTLYFRAYDLSDALLINNNSSAHAANFEYSTDDGTIWSPLGTIANTVGTLVRYTFTTPPGVKIRPGIKES